MEYRGVVHHRSGSIPWVAGKVVAYLVAAGNLVVEGLLAVMVGKEATD